MSIIRRIKRKNKQTGKDEVMDLGALGSNVVQDATHRFVTDTEKTTWNGKVDASGGDISSTKVSTITDSSESFPVPAAGDQTKTWLGKIKKWQQDCLAKFGNYLLTSMIANQHQNNTGTVPSSALAYLMQQAIVANQNSIGVLNTNVTNLQNTKLTFARAENPQSDLNNLRATGLYRYGVSTVSNLPTYDTDSFFVLVIEFSATYILQVYIGFYDTTTQSCHIRALWGTQWKSWRELS